MVPAIEWHLLHPHSMRSSFGSVGPKFVPPPHAPGSPPCCQQVGPPKTTCKEGKWPKQSIQGSCGCPCSLLGIWTRWPLGIPSNSDHCESGGKTQDFSIPFGGYLGKQQTTTTFADHRASKKGDRDTSSLLAGHHDAPKHVLILLGRWLPEMPPVFTLHSPSAHLAPSAAGDTTASSSPTGALRGTSCRPGGFGVDTVVVVGFGSSAGAAAIYTSVSLIAVPVY